jgi:AcrR family transcriptional regulator
MDDNTCSAGSVRERILAAAAQLFSEQGYTAGSTRMIADKAGVTQAALYYHFASKQDLLAKLLAATMKPSLAFAQRLARTDELPHLQLYALAAFDARQLSTAKWNLGTLHLLPELRGTQFEEFRQLRQLLRGAYRRQISDGAQAGLFRVASADVASALVFVLTESVIAIRADGLPADGTLPRSIATSCLRLVECAEADIAEAVIEGACLLASHDLRQQQPLALHPRTRRVKTSRRELGESGNAALSGRRRVTRTW